MKQENLTLPACNYTGEFYTKFGGLSKRRTLGAAQLAYKNLKSKPSFAIRLHDGVGAAGNHTSYQILLKQLIPSPTSVSSTDSKLTAWQRTTFQFHVHSDRSVSVAKGSKLRARDEVQPA